MKYWSPPPHTHMHTQEHDDYEIIQSTNPEFNKAVVRVNIYQEHRQTIQVIVCERDRFVSVCMCAHVCLGEIACVYSHLLMFNLN